MLHNKMSSMKQVFKHPMKQIRFCRNSAMLTIDQEHVRRLGIDSATFFEQVPTENGITLIMHKVE
jgi:hypothetical protein